MHVDACEWVALWCILTTMYDAFMCIKSYSTARFGCIARAIWMHDTCFMIDCMMRDNASKYPKMCENAHECAGLVDHTFTNTREAERTQGYTHMEACSMDRMGFGRAVNACHYMPSRSSSDSSPSPSSSTVSSRGWMRVPATVLRGRWALRVTWATFSTRFSRYVLSKDVLPGTHWASEMNRAVTATSWEQLLEILDALVCIRMHQNAYCIECVRMRTNVCECMRFKMHRVAEMHLKMWDVRMLMRMHRNATT